MFLNWLKNFCKKSPKPFEQAYFIRCTDSGWTAWTSSAPNYVQLAQDYLDSEQLNCSVYNLNKLENEALIATAHSITFLRASIQEAKILRITYEDIKKSGLKIKFTNGETGVEYFDALHWEIVGSKENFAKLAQRLYEATKHGEERFRKVSKDQCKLSMSALHQVNEFSKTPDALENIEKVLNIQRH